uniref:CHR928 n=1 Tax=Arundo donax TaxID=35708 RepID=A0A0A9CQ25_ARUDO
MSISSSPPANVRAFSSSNRLIDKATFFSLSTSEELYLCSSLMCSSGFTSSSFTNSSSSSLPATSSLNS